MATVDLGAIRFNWKGAYAGGTAYVANDVVSSGGSSYICILAVTGTAPPNATYWSIMSSAGTDGTDVAATITTEGDLLYRDGSAPARLAKGTAAQVLTMNGGATAPEWAAVAAGGLVLQVVQNHVNTTSSQTLTINTLTNISNLSASITPASTGSKILVAVRWAGEVSASPQDLLLGLKRDSTAIGSAPTVGSRNCQGITSIGESNIGSTNYDSTLEVCYFEYIDSPSTTSSVTYTATAFDRYAGSTIYHNRTVGDSDATGFERATSSVTLTELSAATTQLNGS